MTTGKELDLINEINANHAKFRAQHLSSETTKPPYQAPVYQPPKPPTNQGGHMSDSKKGRWWKWPLIALVVLALLMAFTPLGDTPRAWASDAWNHLFGEDKPTPNEETLKAVTITVPTEKCIPDDKTLSTVNIRVESLAMVGTGEGQRRWSDSVALPMAGNNQDLALGQIMDTVCHDPHYGHVVAAGLAKLDVGNVALVSRNEWLNSVSIEEIPSSAASYMPTLNNEDISLSDASKAIEKNQEWQVTASYINTLLKNLANMGFHSPQSEWNFHINGYDNKEKLPTVGLNDRQEDMPALVLGLTEKGQDCPIVQIAFNVGDKRPEGVNVCHKPAPPVQNAIVPPAPGTDVHQPPAPQQPPGDTPPSGPPWQPPVEDCTTNPNLPGCTPVVPPCEVTMTCPKRGPVLVEPGVPLAPPDGPPRNPIVPANPFVPGPESLPGAPITGNPATDSGAMAPEAAPVEPDVNRGDSGTGTPAPIDSAAETPAGSTGIGESSTPLG